MSANTKIVVLRRKELLYTGIFAALGVLFVILLLMLLLPGKAADTSGAPDSPDSTAETVMPDNVANLGRIPQSAQTEDVSTGAVADTDAVLDSASGAVDNDGAVLDSVSGPVGTDNTCFAFHRSAAPLFLRIPQSCKPSAFLLRLPW